MESPREMMGQNCSPSVNIKIAGKWIFIPVHECYWLVDFNNLEHISQLGRIIPYIMENRKCSKPPSSYNLIGIPIANCSYRYQYINTFLLV